MTKGRDSNMDRTGAALEALRRRCLTLGEALMTLEGGLQRLEQDYTVLLGLSIRFPARVGFDWLLVVRAERPEGRVVAFVQGRTLFDVLQGFVEGVEGASLRWQADQYAK